MRIAIQITFLTVVIAGCGIFTPRNQFEEPLFIIETDRFSFSKLLENSGENFTSLHLDEVFSESFTYKDINSRGGLPYDKNQIKDKLRQIESEYPEIRIEWVDSSFTRKETVSSLNRPDTLFSLTRAVLYLILPVVPILHWQEVRGGRSADGSTCHRVTKNHFCTTGIEKKWAGKFSDTSFPFLIVIPKCFNPFFPETGKPTMELYNRFKPDGVISQLVESYESRRIDLFEQLLSESFRFYVAPSFNTGSSVFVTKYNIEREAPDINLQYIDNSESYFFWTKEPEKESHTKLFKNAEQIKFAIEPIITRKRFITDENGDTVNVELMVEGSEMEIRVKNSDTDVELYTVSIEQQVFYLERDKERLWVIGKWYDLSTAPNLD